MNSRIDIKTKIKSKNKIVIIFSFLLVFLFVLIIYIYDSYLANWYIDKIPYRSRTIFHMLIDTSVMFVPLILCLITIFYLLKRTIVYSNADEILSCSKNKAVKGISIDFSIEELKNTILKNGYIYDNSKDLYYCVFSNGIFKKKLLSVLVITEYESIETINERIQRIEDTYIGERSKYDFAVSVIAYDGDISFSKIKEYVLDFQDRNSFVLNPAYIDFMKNKSHVFTIGDLYSKTFCLHSQTIEYLISNNK